VFACSHVQSARFNNYKALSNDYLKTTYLFNLNEAH